MLAALQRDSDKVKHRSAILPLEEERMNIGGDTAKP